MVGISTFSALSIPRLLGDSVKILETEGASLSSIYPLVWWMLFYALVRGVTLFFTRFLIIGASRRIEYNLRNRLFGHLLSLDRAFYNSAKTGDIMTRTTLDVEAARIIAGPAIMYSISCLFMLSIAIPLMISVDLFLTLLVMIPLTFLSLLVRFIGPRVHSATLLAQESLGEISSCAQENFGGMRIVKAFSVENRAITKFRQLCDNYFNRCLATEKISNMMGPIVGAIGGISVILLLIVGGNLTLEGNFSLGDIFKFLGYQALLLWPMISIGWVVNQVFRGVASIERLDQIFSSQSAIIENATKDDPSETSKRTSDTKASQFRGELKIQNLNFSHGDRPILKNINMSIPAGKRVAILGHTGSGKSTLVSLIPRLHPIPDGTIFLDGVDINHMPISRLRGEIGFVPQETFLFSRTIGENIAFGIWNEEDDDLDEKIESFGEISRMDKDLDQFSRGYQEIVGERGVTLSGGQRQRVAISRALMGNPAILIFDDALSAVDTHTEEEILANLSRTTGDLTVLVVSHRISSIKSADYIYVLDEGCISEEGTHEDLLKKKGIYEKLYRHQLLEDELEEM